MSSPVFSEDVLDGHCHIASTHFIPRAFFEGVAGNVAVKLAAAGVRKPASAMIDSYLKQHQDHDADLLVRDMDDAGIAKSVLLLPDFTCALPCELTIAEMFWRHKAVLQRHPGRFEVFAGVDPRWGTDGVQLFEQGLSDMGFRGLKLYPPCGYSPSDRRLYPFYELCRAHGVPVLLHVGPTSPSLSFAYASPWLVDQAALDFPDVDFILAHGAVHFVGDCASLCAYRPNVYLDTSAFLGSTHPGGWAAGLAALFRKGINHKILFGTDWPLFRTGGGHKRVMRAFCGADGPLAGVSLEQRRWIMRENMKRLLRRAGEVKRAAP
jgi:uncharacterized protein